MAIDLKGGDFDLKKGGKKSKVVGNMDLIPRE